MTKLYVDDDDEPSFRIRLISDQSTDSDYKYWEKYNPFKKTWFRLCDECMRRVCKASDSLCAIHYNKENKSKEKIVIRSRKMARKLKRLDTKVKKKMKKQKCLLETVNDIKIEEIIEDKTKPINQPLTIVISVSSSLSKKQISAVKEFVTKFHNEYQSIQFTCESQPDYVDDTTTHVITNDCGSFTTTLSKQIIQACVHHIFISSINWITSSIAQSSIVNHFPYEILRDKKSLNTSRGIKQCRFDQLPVFPSSCIISVECHLGIKSMKMTREELIEIVELSGATLLNEYMQYETLIILCNSKKEMCDIKKRNDENSSVSNEKPIYYCKPEFLFNSIVRHEVQLIEKYCW